MQNISPYENPYVIVGNGTAAKELIEESGELDVLIATIGGGGLISGCCLAAKELSPNCRIYGVEPANNNHA